jgi:hypothetical protein
MTKIFARETSFTDDGKCTLLGFADNPDNPVKYVMLQISNEPDEEEISFGWGGVHIDTGDLQINGYDLVQDIDETESGVIITIVAEAAEEAGIERFIEIELERKAIEGIGLAEAVQKFRDRIVSWGGAKIG